MEKSWHLSSFNRCLGVSTTRKYTVSCVDVLILSELLLPSSLFDHLSVRDTLPQASVIWFSWVLWEYVKSLHCGVWKTIQIIWRRSSKENEILNRRWWFFCYKGVGLFTVSLCGFSEIVRWTVTIPLRARTFKGTEWKTCRGGGGGEELGFLSEPPPGARISRPAARTALTADKAAISLPIPDTVSNCHPLSESTLPVQRRSQKAIGPRQDMMAVLEEKKRGPLIEQTGYFLPSRDNGAVTLRYRVGWGHQCRVRADSAALKKQVLLEKKGELISQGHWFKWLKETCWNLSWHSFWNSHKYRLSF